MAVLDDISKGVVSPLTSPADHQEHQEQDTAEAMQWEQEGGCFEGAADGELRLPSPLKQQLQNKPQPVQMVSSPQGRRLGQKQHMQQAQQQQQRQGVATGQLPRSVPAACTQPQQQRQQGSAAVHLPRPLPAAAAAGGAPQLMQQQEVGPQAQQQQGGVTARPPPALLAKICTSQQLQQQQQKQVMLPQMQQQQGGMEDPVLAFSPTEPVAHPAQQQQQQQQQQQKSEHNQQQKQGLKVEGTSGEVVLQGLFFDPLPDLSLLGSVQPMFKVEWEQSGPRERAQHLQSMQSWPQPTQGVRNSGIGSGSGTGSGASSLGRACTRVDAPNRAGPSGFRGPVHWKHFCGRGADLDQRQQRQQQQQPLQQWRRQSVDSAEQDARALLSNLDVDCEVDSPRVGGERSHAGSRGRGQSKSSRDVDAGQAGRQRSRSRSPVVARRVSGDAGQAAAAVLAGTCKKQRQQGLCANNAAGQPAAAAVGTAGAGAAGRGQSSALAGSNSLSLLITQGMDILKFPLSALQALVPGLKLQQHRIQQLQVVFVEQTGGGEGPEGVRVLAGPCQAPAPLAAGGIVGFFGQPLKVTLASQQLLGRTIIGCCPANSILPDSGSTGGILSIAFTVQPAAGAAAGIGCAASAAAAVAGAVEEQHQQDDMDIDQQDGPPSASASAGDAYLSAATAAPTAELPVETPQQLEQIQGQPSMVQATNSAAFQQQAYSAAFQQQPYSAAHQQQPEQLQLGTGAVMTDAHTPYIKPDPELNTSQDPTAAAATAAPQVPIKQEPQEVPAGTLGCKKQTSPSGLEQGTASAAIAAAAAALRKKDTCSQPGRTGFAVHALAASEQPARSAPAAAAAAAKPQAPAAAGAATAAASTPRLDPVGEDSADTLQSRSESLTERFAAANPATARTLTAAAFAALPTDTAAFCPVATETPAAFAAGTTQNARLAAGCLAEILQPLQAPQHTSPISTVDAGLAGQCTQPIPQYPDLTGADAPRMAPVTTSIIKQEAAPYVVPPTPIAAAGTAATPIAAAGTAGTAGTVVIKQEPAVQRGLPASPSTPSAALAEATGSIAPLAGSSQGPAGLPQFDCSIPVAVLAAGAGQDAAAATAGDADVAAATAAAPGGQPTACQVGSTSSAAEGSGAEAAGRMGCSLPAGATATAVVGAAGSVSDAPGAAVNPAQPRSPTVPPEGQAGRLVPSPASSLGGVAAPAAGDVGAPGTLIALGSGISSSTETLCMPALPALPAMSVSGADRFKMSDGVVQAVMDLVMFLHKHQDSTLDFLGCIEALQDLREQPDAAARFMRVGYAALTSAVRMNNAAAAVKVVQRYLQK